MTKGQVIAHSEVEGDRVRLRLLLLFHSPFLAVFAAYSEPSACRRGVGAFQAIVISRCTAELFLLLMAASETPPKKN